MRKLIYSMGVSVDGFIAGSNGEIDWSAPDEELHRFHNDQARELGVHLCGRRLYETMVYWEAADQNPAASEFELGWDSAVERLTSPALDHRLNLELFETRTFGSRVLYVRYRRP